MTTNLAFARWSEVFLDATAAAVRSSTGVVHHAVVLEADSDSYRLKAAKAKAARRKGTDSK